MNNGPTASNSLGMIGVELYRLHEGPASAINLTFVVVQTDWKWISWYSFYDDASSTDNFQSSWNGEGTRAADIYGCGFGRTKHEFRRVFLHTTRAVRVDGLLGDDRDHAPAVMFVRNSLEKGNVLVDIDIDRTDGVLQLRRLHMAGHIPKKFDAKNTRGAVYRETSAHLFQKKELVHPPVGSQMQLG